jgi:hypothetical protein
MIIVQFLVLSLVGGTILGFGLRAYDIWREKKQ